MKNKKLLLCSGLLTATIIACVSFSLSWFDTRTNFQPNEIFGSSENAYFAYGNGTAEKPFGITNPRHLYNLAWLQYMGKFNKTDSDGNVTQVYFELGSDIDMSTFNTALPPIGTISNPFVGVFNGKNKTISNLKVSSNSKELTKKPYLYSTTFNEPNIIGMFGVVGKIEGETSDLKYDSQVLSISGFKLENPVITTNQANALTGIVAGYVNGSISDVQLEEPKLKFTTNTGSLKTKYSKFTNVSNYSVAGYCEPDYEQEISSTVTTLYNKTSDAVQFTKQEAGDGQGWGGSIEMETMYNNLKTKWNVFTSSPTDTATKYTTSSTVTYDINGNRNEVETGTNVVRVASGSLSTDYIYNQSSKYYGSYISFYQSADNDGSDTTSSYTFVIEKPDSASSSSTESRYMCLTGYGKRAIKNGKTITYTNKKQTNTFLISYKDGDNNNHYLGYNSTNAEVIDTTSSNAVSFYLSSEGYLLTSLSGTDNYPKYYYLKNDGGLLTLEEYSSNVTPTIWEYDDNAQTFCNGFYFLMCDKDEEESTNIYYWSLDENQNSIKYQFYIRGSQTYYLNASGSSITASESNDTDWYLDNSNYIYTIINGIRYYVQGSYSRNNSSFSLNNSSSAKCLKYNASSKTLSCVTGNRNRTYYLTWDSRNSSWSLSTSTTEITANTIGETEKSYNLSNDTIGKTIYVNDTSSETVNSEFETNDTYFPLNNTNGVPNQKNTGYVVSGSNYFADAYGDIRVSKFNITDLSSFDASSKTLTSVYTVNNSGVSVDITNSTAYKKYKKSKASLENVLSTSYNNNDKSVYGLHFMNASIGLKYNDGHEVRVPKAVINGQEYQNYQLPYDCIDFNLKDKGYINFFAGTYYSGNNSFFSLYEIKRYADNASNIKELKKIKNIYSTGNAKDDYVYEYDDGTTSGDITGLNTIFKTAWIEKNTVTGNVAYYFEIPVNAGEYALGSVSGANGAYLIYLDIGANAQVVNRTTVTELVEQTRATYKFAKGICIISAGISDTTASNSYCVLIEDITSSSGSDVSFNRDASTANITYTNTADISCDYKKDALKLKINDKDSNIKPLSSTSKFTKKLTYYDYSVNDGTIEVYQLTKDTDYGSSDVTSTDRYYVIDADGNIGDDQTEYTVYDENGQKVDDPTSSITIDTGSDMNQIYQFLAESSTGTTEGFTITFENVGALSSETDDNGYYKYLINGYKFTLTNSSGVDVTATVTIKQIGDNTYSFTINGNDGNTLNAILIISLKNN